MPLLTLAALALQAQGTLHTDLTPGPGDSYPGEFVRTPDFLFFTTSTSPFSVPPAPFFARTSVGTPGSFETLPSFDNIFSPFGVGGRVMYASSCFFFPCSRLYSSGGDAPDTEIISVPGSSEFLPKSLPVEFAGAWVYGNSWWDESGAVWTTKGSSATTERQFIPLTVSGSTGTFVVEVAPLRQQVVGDRLFVEQNSNIPLRFLVSLGKTLDDPIVEFVTDGLLENLQLTGAVGDRALFAVTRIDGTVELLSTGTGAAAPVLHGVLRPAPWFGGADWFAGPTVEGGQLYVTVRSDGTQRVIVVDGITPGWTELLDLTGYETLDRLTSPISPETGGGAALLAGRTGQSAELWFTDGSVAGTVLSGAMPFEFADRTGTLGAPFSDRRVLVAGLESDGNARLRMATPTGITVLAEPGAAGELGMAYPSADTTTFDGDLYYSAWTPSAGRELHSLPLSQVAAPTAHRVFGGCAATTAEIARIDSVGDLKLGAAALFRLSGAPPNTPALWFYGTNDAPVGDFGDCSSALASATFGWTLTTNANGLADWSITVPSLAGLVGTPFRLQSLVLDGTGPFLGLASLSDALEITVAP